MAERNPDDRAAFGVFPQLKRNRSKQDREAAKNVPVDLARGALAGVLGAPGDIESLVRMLPYLDEKTVLPTSEDIEKKLPFRSDTPVSRAATGLGTLGGGFYYGPGSPLKVVGALPRAIKHGAEEFAKASVAGVPHVIKPKGGNWFGTSVEDAMSGLKRGVVDEEAARRLMGDDFVNQRMSDPVDNALNKWVDSNLTNYVKKQMATPEDPVRKLAEEGIVHIPSNEVGINRYKAPKHRELYEGEQLGQSEAAKAWEDASDVAINAPMVNKLQAKNFLDRNPWIKNLPMEQRVYALNNPASSRQEITGLGFDHILDVLRQDVREGRIRPEQLNKVSMEQAVRRTYEYDQEMARKMRETALKQQEGFPVHKEYPEGYKWVELGLPKASDVLPEGWTMLEPKGGVMRAVNPAGDRVIGNDMPELIKNLYYRHPDTPGNPRQMLEEALKYEGNTMGHCVGGYCPDVVEGKSRIFSLRDAKGEPHVTIETQPSKYAPRWDIVKQYMTAATEEAKKLPNGYTDNDVSDIAIRMAKENEPEQIVQIKGKQNAKPKDDYLPFVQDFVKGGKWSDIRDFKNTGLIREGDQIMTPAEHADWLLKELGADTYNELGLGAKIPPAAGMKRGGKVSISNNPDAMMLELNNKKMAKGGLTKLIKGAKEALKAEPEIMKASEALGKIEGRPLVITQADRTKVGEGFLGGPGFSSLQLTEPEYRAAEAAWGVKTPGVAKMILGGAKKAGDNPVFTTMIGSPTQHQSNQMVFDKLYGDFKKAAKKGGLPTELRDKINDRLVRAVDKEGNPVFPSDIDILDKNFKDIANTFDRRSIAGHLMGGVQVGGKKGQIIDYDKIIRETTDPALIDVPSGSLGNRLFTLSGGIIDRPDLHPAFPTILQGEDLGVQFSPVVKDILMRDFIEKTMREKGRKPGYMDFTRGHPPSQLITEDILTEMQKLGLKEGGAVKKAEGGEINADDLIIEERPL